MVATISASAASKNSLVVLGLGLAVGRHDRRAGHEVLHDGAEDGRLEVLPLAVGLGHGDEVVAEEHAGDARHREQAPRQRRGRARRSASRKSTVPAASTSRPGRNFRVAGFGVASVWMNMGCSMLAQRGQGRAAAYLEFFQTVR